RGGARSPAAPASTAHRRRRGSAVAGGRWAKERAPWCRLCSCRGRDGPRRQANRHPGAAPLLRADLNFAAVVVDDPMHDRQPEAAALCERAMERLEQLVELLGRDADALIVDRNDDAVRLDAAGEPEPAALRHRAQT